MELLVIMVMMITKTSTITRKGSPRPTELAYLLVEIKFQIVLLCHVTLCFQKVFACIFISVA